MYQLQFYQQCLRLPLPSRAWQQEVLPLKQSFPIFWIKSCLFISLSLLWLNIFHAHGCVWERENFCYPFSPCRSVRELFFKAVPSLPLESAVPSNFLGAAPVCRNTRTTTAVPCASPTLDFCCPRFSGWQSLSKNKLMLSQLFGSSLKLLRGLSPRSWLPCTGDLQRRCIAFFRLILASWNLTSQCRMLYSRPCPRGCKK